MGSSVNAAVCEENFFTNEVVHHVTYENVISTINGSVAGGLVHFHMWGFYLGYGQLFSQESAMVRVREDGSCHVPHSLPAG
jgi:hypothetical protein